MPADLAHALAQQAGSLGLGLVFSGGEPMIRKDLVLTIARSVAGKCRSIAVYSNCYWAKDDVETAVFVRQLKDAGVDALLTSTDLFHHDFIPAHRVERAALHASSAGLHCEVAVPTPEKNRTHDELVERLRSIPNVHVKMHGLSATGRAVRLSESSFAVGVHDTPCTVIGELSVTPEGFVYPCCAGSIDSDVDSRLCIGNVRDEPLDSFVRRLQEDPLFADIQASGPLRAAILEHGRNAAFPVPERFEFTDICATCRFYFAHSHQPNGSAGSSS